MPSVLALGLDPVFADYSQMPQFSPEMVRAFIEVELARIGVALVACNSGRQAGQVDQLGVRDGLPSAANMDREGLLALCAGLGWL